MPTGSGCGLRASPTGAVSVLPYRRMGERVRACFVLQLVGCAVALEGNSNTCYNSCCFAPVCASTSCPDGTTLTLQSCAAPCCVPNKNSGNSSCCKLVTPTPAPPSPKPGKDAIARPTAAQLAWQDFEIGSLNSFQMVTFHPGGNGRGGQLHPNRPFDLASPSMFTPWDLNTDAWAKAQVSFGARYSVLNVKDESGFLLFPSKCSDILGQPDYSYSIKQSPVYAKYGDVTQRFVDSSRKYGLIPGVYYLGWGNFHLNITNTGSGGYDCQQDTPQTRRFEQISLCHLEELYRNYGAFAEIWFDGGAPCRPEFTKAILNLTKTYQPQAVTFQGPPQLRNNIRWIGTEAGVAPEDTWSCARSSQDYGAGYGRAVVGVQCVACHRAKCKGDCRVDLARLHYERPRPKRGGIPAFSATPAFTSPLFVPAEADTCIRTAAGGGGSSGCWLWYPNTTDSVKSLETLRTDYLTTVGHNANFLLNLSPNTDGTIDDADMKAYSSLGRWIRATFQTPPLADATNSSCAVGSGALNLTLPAGNNSMRYIVLQEDQSDGQRVWGFEVLTVSQTSSTDAMPVRRSIYRGQSIGHKRILDCQHLAAVSEEAERGLCVRARASAQSGKQKQMKRARTSARTPATAQKVIFSDCQYADHWAFNRSDGTVRNSSDASMCLTLTAAAARFTAVVTDKCGGALASRQVWKYNDKNKTDPLYSYLSYDGRGSSIDAKYCIQIDGNCPWRGNQAVVWDCQAGSWDEFIVKLDDSTLHTRLMIDMKQGGGPQLCMSGSSTRPQDSICENVRQVELRISETADSKPAAIRGFAAF